MSFAEELNSVLPSDLPNRATVIAKCALHLQMIEDRNRVLNLTRITSPREAAIKHVLDSVLPWREFESGEVILDAGTGAGFPGIPLAVVLPSVKFILSESIGKKARFVEETVAALALPNAVVDGRRSEDILKGAQVPTLVARAVAALDRAIPMFGDALQRGLQAYFFKGPDIESELMKASQIIERARVRAEIIARYNLPDDMGSRTLVRVARPQLTTVRTPQPK